MDLAKKIDKIIDRMEDSLILSRMNFYSPKMNGEWTIKSIIKAIPDCPVSYNGQDNIGGGDEAQLAWFIYTDVKTNDDQKFIELLCKRYTSTLLSNKIFNG